MERFFQSRLNIITTVLGIIAFFGAIAAQIVATKRTANEAIIASWTARVGDERQRAEANAKRYKADIEKQIALNAEARTKAEAELEAANAEIAKANSVYARQQAEAEAARKEAELAQIKPKIQWLKLQVITCARPCFHEHANVRPRYGERDYYGCMTKCIIDNGSSR
jgi:hypothetical protein